MIPPNPSPSKQLKQIAQKKNKNISILIAIKFKKTKISVLYKFFLFVEHRPHGRGDVPVLPRSESTSEFQPLEDKSVEYFFASDASAVIEHTNRVIYFEVSFLHICALFQLIFHFDSG